jgi:hypothetical protein
MIELVGRYIDNNRSGYECSMVWYKLYSETSPDDGTVEGRDDGTVIGLEDGVVVIAGVYSQPQNI